MSSSTSQSNRASRLRLKSRKGDDAPRFAIPGRLNLTIAAAQLVATAGLFWMTACASTWLQLSALAGAFAILGNSIYSTVHEAEHGLFYPQRAVNEGVGVFFALLFPAPFHLIRQGHLGHHRRNRSDDEAFDLYFEGDRPWIKWLVLYGILTGFYWVLAALSNVIVVVCPGAMQRRFFEFDRPSAAFMESLNPRYWGLIRLEGLCAVVLHVLIVQTLSIPWANYAIVYAGFGWSWSAMQYVHHFGAERHVLRGARNLRLWGPVDLLWLHHNWHRVHHEFPTIPWLYLPSVARANNDADREFLIWRYLRMWRGPRFTDHRVENKYAGKVIR